MTSIVRRNLINFFPKKCPNVFKSHVSLSLYYSTSTENPQSVEIPAISEFLIHKHHFSPEAASRFSPFLIRPQNADSVLSFLKEKGFSNTQLEKLVILRPRVLLSCLDKCIKPKIAIFEEMGFSPTDITEIFVKDPSIFHRSINNRIIPTLDVLKGLLGSIIEVAKLLRSNRWVLSTDMEKSLMPNIEILKSCGIPLEQIIRHICMFPSFFLCSPENMRRYVDKADEMGFDRSSRLFIYAARIVGTMNNKTWKLKLKAFQNLGFSEDGTLRMFMTAPVVLSVSEEKIKKVKEILLETEKYDLSCIVRDPASLMYSVEKRYKPRLQVLRVLENRNLIKKWPSLGSLYQMSDKKFVEKFVAPYLNEVGDIFIAKNAFSGKKEIKLAQRLV